MRAVMKRVLSAWVIAAGLLPLTVGAEPRPDPYDSGTDDFVDTRRSLRDRDWTQALAHLETISRQNPEVIDRSEYHNLMGYTLRHLGPDRLDKAISHYQEALRIDPTHIQAREYLGQAYLTMNRIDLAQEQLKRIEATCLSQTCEPWQSLNQAILARQGRH